MASSTFLTLIFPLLIFLSFLLVVSADQELNSTWLNEFEGGINITWKSYGWCKIDEAVSLEENRRTLFLNISPIISQLEIVYDRQDVCPVLEDTNLPGGGRNVNMDSVHQGRLLIGIDSVNGNETKGHGEKEIDTEHPPDNKTELTIHIRELFYSMEPSDIFEHTGIYPISLESWQDLASSIYKFWTTLYHADTYDSIRVWHPDSCFPGFETQYGEYMNNHTYQEFDPRTSNWTEVRRRLNRLDVWPEEEQWFSDYESEYRSQDDDLEEKYERITLMPELRIEIDMNAFGNELEATISDSGIFPDAYVGFKGLRTNETRPPVGRKIWEPFFKLINLA